MYNLYAIATRAHGRIHVHLSGQLANPSYFAEIYDKYPGGNRQYVVDPGVARVFIAETQKTPEPGAAQVVVPWFSSIDIPDETHTSVQVLVNEMAVLDVNVIEPDGKYIVYALTGAIRPDGRCIIVPQTQHVLSIYTPEFGPAPYEECSSWVEEHCPCT
ncbi:MAG: hypothetical protein ABFE08_02740 [Armatimonadia bacterium]